MKLQQKVNTVRRSENFEEKKFKMDATGKAFDILSNSLYSNKVRAIIRELSCNAYDAHKEADSKKKFKVHLPNQNDSSFWIRDFGTGISEKDIFEIYTTYFASTKSDTNDFVGCLGLGSKTPFAYTDNFTVTSFFNGIKYVFSCFKSESGEPAIAKLSEEPTSEENGLEVKLAIKKEDWSEFAKEATEVYKWFDKKPEFVDSYVRPGTITKTVIGSTWFIERNNNKPAAVMGNIRYPISLKNLEDKTKKETLEILQHVKPVLEFPVGALEIAPSREHLQYQKTTIKAIEKRVEDIAKDIEKHIKETLDKSKNKWDASLALSSLFSGKFGSYIRAVADSRGLEWKGHKLKQKYSYKDIFNKAPTGRDDDIVLFEYSQKYDYKTSSYKTTTSYGGTAITHFVTSDVIYIFVDLGNERSYSNTKLRAWMRANSEKYKNFTIRVISRPKEKIDDIEKIIDHLGLTKNENYFWWHDLPTIARSTAQKGGKKRKKTESKYFNTKKLATSWWNFSNLWEDYEKVDLEDGEGIYVARKANKILYQSIKDPETYLELSSYHLNDLFDLIELYNYFYPNSKIARVHSFTPTQLKIKGDNWKDLFKLLEEKISNLWTDDVQNTIHKKNKIDNFKRDNQDFEFKGKLLSNMIKERPSLGSRDDWKEVVEFEEENSFELNTRTKKVVAAKNIFNRLADTAFKNQLKLKEFKEEPRKDIEAIKKIFKSHDIIDLIYSQVSHNYYWRKNINFRTLKGWKHVCEIIEFKENKKAGELN